MNDNRKGPALIIVRMSRLEKMAINTGGWFALLGPAVILAALLSASFGAFLWSQAHAGNGIAGAVAAVSLFLFFASLLGWREWIAARLVDWRCLRNFSGWVEYDLNEITDSEKTELLKNAREWKPLNESGALLGHIYQLYTL